MQPLETAIRLKFLPKLLGEKNPISAIDRELFALPVKLGGLAIDNPVADTPDKFTESVKLTSALTVLIETSTKEYAVLPETALSIKRALQFARNPGSWRKPPRSRRG